MAKVNHSATKTGHGDKVVQWVDAKGKTFNAKVTGGSGTTLNLRIESGYPASARLKTGIVKRTSLTQTNVWF